jgi:NAD(P)-dependent dehydrogenase (short-subunit alcohol dehydrogenase family)
VALITGGTRGIGYGCAEALAAEGHDLALCGMRTPDQVADVLAPLREHGAEVLYLQADVGSRSDRRNLIAGVRNHFGRLHVLVNNAGVAPTERRDLLEATEESFERLLRINLQGPYFLIQAAANWMIEQQQADPNFQGRIINVTSVSSVMASTNRGEYCVSKAGLTMATRLWAARLGEFDIPVYEVQPGVIATDMTKAVKEKYDRLIAEGLMVQPRWGQPADVGRTIAMLARGDLAYSTGQVIAVDGGLMLPRL